ncbi:CarD family transcriptional regulator [Bacillus horti]|uniref:CarD family transcriptional regulator n=1 Tax=Caldalkalibacillus horti TaxID=77523 RepID=A0ABT9VYY4_9BACI|nr:CarD family transcriptional regulator [Bacillus horti]MDQ0166037.1 CarD family transcriptional regulator [Bacillus horti]
MFDVGDKVVYPMHGAGIIEGIEEKEILGQKKKYFIMRMPIGEMKVMIPMENVSHIGLRQVVGLDAVNRVMDILGTDTSDEEANWNQRYRANMDKMKSGDIYEIADVVRSLMVRDRAKGLSTGERKMLDQAKQILISELALVEDRTSDELFSMLDGIVYEKDASL